MRSAYPDKQQASRQNIEFRPLDNGFASCENPQTLAQICHSLSAEDVRLFAGKRRSPRR